MKTTVITCDICLKELPKTWAWQDKPKALSFASHCASQNPMARILDGQHQAANFLAEDVCPSCMKAIAEAVAAKIESLRTS